MVSAAGTLSFNDVEAGKIPSASNQNRLHDAVRNLQQGRPSLNGQSIELHRIEPASVDTARPDVSDAAIGTAVVAKGTTTIHRMETDSLSSVTSVATIKEMDATAKRPLSNIGQKFFSRDEVFTMLILAGSGIPIKLAGAEKIILKTSTTIAAAVYAIDEITPGFATADVYDWNAAGTKIIKTNKTCRVANMVSAVVASGVFIQAFMLGKVYVVDWEACP